MFDDQPNNQNIPPSNLPAEPVDMFAEVEKDGAVGIPAEQPPDALSAGMLKKKEEVSAPMADMNAGAMNPAPMYAMKEPILGKIILGVVFIAVLGGLGYGGWWVYANYFNKTAANTNEITTDLNTANNAIEVPVNNTINTPEVTTPTPEGVGLATTTVATATIPTDVELNRDINNDKILFGEPIDSDKDGLDDVREKEIGTDPNKADTDGDGLIDGDEVIIWKTNPLKADTDGDGYPDGSEVRNGYNPLGPGKLFNQQTNTSTPKSTSTSTKKSTSTKP